MSVLGMPIGSGRATRLVRRLPIAHWPGLRTIGLPASMGLAQCATVVVQAVLLATVLERVLGYGAPLGSLTGQLVGLAVAIAARGVLAWTAEMVAQRTTFDVASRLRRDLLRRILELGPSWLATERTGELAVTSTVGTEAIGRYAGRYLPQLVVAALCPAALVVWIGYSDWLSVVILLVLAAMIPPTMVAFGRRASVEANRQWRRLSSLSAQVLELVYGLPTLRAFGQVARGRRQILEATEGLRRSTLGTLKIALLSSLALEMLAALGTGLVAMALGLRLLYGGTSLYVALAVVLVAPEVFLPMRRAAQEFHLCAEGKAASERVQRVLGTEPRRSSGPCATDTHSLDGSLLIDGATVELSDRTRIGPVSVSLRAGERVALVGPSGTGKSSLLHAVAGLVALSSGRIECGGSDISCVPAAAWRRNVAWLPQRPHLFSGTILHNLEIARPDADRRSLEWAIAVSGLDEVLARLPAGVDTAVGEGGLSLSSGERHRIALARALLHGGHIVLFDEIGAPLDPESRAALGAALGPWLQDKTVLVATHHPGEVVPVDAIVEIGAGHSEPQEALR
ncbi:MAG: thiol reductant ABC exporter subunit CydD [Acidimicrobiales bacterium]